VYCLATTHSVTDRRADRRTDRQHYHADSRSYCMQYDRQKSDSRSNRGGQPSAARLSVVWREDCVRKIVY